MTTTIDLFRDATDYVTLPAGHVLFRLGDPADRAYVVLEGEVDIRVKDRLIDTVSVGGIVGEMALIDQSRRSATVIARKDCRLAPLDQKRLLFLIQETPYFAVTLMKIMCERMRKLLELE